MSRFGDSSPSRPRLDQPGTLAARRHSSTLSLHDAPTREDARSSQSKKRLRHQDENGPLSQEWNRSVQGLLKARRPSYAPSISESFQRARKPRLELEESPEQVKISADGRALPESPEEGKGFRSNLEINVKDLVGDAVGNMSISPTSRDIVLAARRGLFIIDLESPFSIPRFLPQGGTWDVADVQWNPHHSHSQYIVSTSCEKMLIWNLHLGGKTSIEHILKSHYRAITDINWHTTECDIVVSTGIDSWVWAWDLRTPAKPIFGLSAFKAGGTQVKWNRQDSNLLASSHSNEVLIWDRRKGSLPVTQITAHSSKIYGIDWSRCRRSEIVTCALDKTIKTWDINSASSEPESCIRTAYPVWRARYLPFGDGILSLPQRGETTLEMYAKNDTQSPVEVFEGHSDVVKEFVWRKGKQDDFQLITWSKDRTLRFWPIDPMVMQKVGHVAEIIRGRSKLARSEVEDGGTDVDTFPTPPLLGHRVDLLSALSAPLAYRSILAEYIVPQPIPQQPPSYYSPGQNMGLSSSVEDEDLGADATPTLTSTKPISMAAAAVASRSTGETMSKRGTGPKSVMPLDQLAWLASVKVGSKRGSSSGGSAVGGKRGESGGNDGGGSGAPSRLGSRSRPRMPSGPNSSASETDIGGKQRSGSLSRVDDRDRRDGEGNQTLQDEITTVLTKLAASKIKLEKHDLTKKRTCTLGLHGPWGETSSVFMRVTFTFPRDYPSGTHPNGTPVVEIERNSLITMSNRSYIVKRLKRIRERKRPCLEACLRFLLFADEGRQNEDALTDSDSETSDDDDDSDDDGSRRGPKGKKGREITVSLLRNTKNLAEPRTSQGAFGPNGELICFFRAPPRIVRNVLRGLTEGATKNTNEEAIPPNQEQSSQLSQTSQQQQKTSYFQSPALVSDAVRRLGLAAMDRTMQPIDPRQPETGLNILRAMTNLLTMPQPKMRRDSFDSNRGDVPKNYALLSSRRSTVFLTTTTNIAGADQKVATGYIFTADSGSNSLSEVCDRNAVVARDYGRYDHERVFRTLRTLFRTSEGGGRMEKWRPPGFSSDTLAKQVIMRLYSDIAKEKDVQMLAMIAMLVLQTEHGAVLPSVLSTGNNRKKTMTPTPTISFRAGNMDYFSLTKSNNPSSPISPAWPRIPSSSVALPLAPSVSSSNSSRGSWSSLFNTGSMRNFMSGMQDTFKDGLMTPMENLPPTPDIHITASKSGDRLSRMSDSPGGVAGRRKRSRKDSSIYTPAVVSRSWNDGPTQLGRQATVSFSSAGHKRPSLRFVDSNPFIHEKHAVVFEPPAYEESVDPLFEPKLIEQFKLNVYYYAELLFRWKMFHKRLELLKAINKEEILPTVKAEPHRIGLQRVCTRSDCKNLLPEKGGNVCQHCGTPCSMAACTVCRLPVKGLSRTCITCSHVTHISCWNSLEVDVPICPSGCGCFCSGADGPFTRPSTRLGLTPPISTLFLAAEA